MNVLKSSVAAVALAVIGVGVGSVQAASVDAVAVGSATSTTQVGNTVGGDIEYFIPLSGVNAGVYGVDVVAGGIAGTFSDTGSGYGYNTPGTDALEMYLYFELSGLDNPAGTSELVLEFEDLDLTSHNTTLLEDLQIQYFDADDNEIDLTGTVTAESQLAGILSHPNGINNGPGGKDQFRLTFTGLTGLINDLQAVNKDLYLKLDFSSLPPTELTNTAELLLGSTLTTTAVVPLPAAAWMAFPLFGGLGVTQLIRRRKLAV